MATQWAVQGLCQCVIWLTRHSTVRVWLSVVMWGYNAGRRPQQSQLCWAGSTTVADPPPPYRYHNLYSTWILPPNAGKKYAQHGTKSSPQCLQPLTKAPTKNFFGCCWLVWAQLRNSDLPVCWITGKVWAWLQERQGLQLDWASGLLLVGSLLLSFIQPIRSPKSTAELKSLIAFPDTGPWGKFTVLWITHTQTGAAGTQTWAKNWHWIISMQHLSRHRHQRQHKHRSYQYQSYLTCALSWVKATSTRDYILVHTKSPILNMLNIFSSRLQSFSE